MIYAMVRKGRLSCAPGARLVALRDDEYVRLLRAAIAEQRAAKARAARWRRRVQILACALAGALVGLLILLLIGSC